MVESEIKRISKYLQLPVGKLSYTDDNIIQMKSGEEKIVGFSSIINHFHATFDKENKTSENYFLAKQFFDFANIFIRSTSKRDKYAACLELSSYLKVRSYLIGQSISLADLVVFYAIYDIMKHLTPQEKENYLHLSRWFDHLQQVPEIRQGAGLINLSSIHLLANNAKA